MDSYNQDKKRKKSGLKFKKTDKKKPNNDKGDGDFQWRRGGRTAVVWVMFALALMFFYQLMNNIQDETEPEITYSEYTDFLINDKIESAIIIDSQFKGILRSSTVINREDQTINVLKFKAELPPNIEKDQEKWEAHNVDFSFKKKEIDWAMSLVSILPWILIIGLWIFFFRKMQGGGGSKGIFSFGKSRAKLLVENKPKITFNDVAGCDEAKAELQEIIEFLKLPERYERLGGKIPKGALLVGPPGTGKTLLARAVAGEAGVPFFSISGADFVELFVGVGASRVRDLFEQGKKNAPCIVFIDEIDAVGRSRGAGLGGGNDEREQTLNALLVEMDGFEDNEGVIIIAATNRPDVLDTALLRPGRFDRQIVVDRPDVRGREGILRVHTKNIPLDANVEIQILAKGTPGMSGADLANLANEAALLAARLGKNKVDMDDFEEAKDKVMMGAERKSMVISEKEKESTAYHESGHVIVGKLTEHGDPIHKVTIIPRGRALGVTTSLPIDDRHTYSRDYCESTLAKLMGGRVAEMLIYNSLTTGAGNDIEQATNLARKMVCEWGMSIKIGPMTFGKKDEEIFLGRDITASKGYSEETARMIDAEIKSIIEDAENTATKILKSNLDILKSMTAELLKREILDNLEIEKIMNKETLDPFVSKEEKNGQKKKTKGNKVDIVSSDSPSEGESVENNGADSGDTSKDKKDGEN